MTVSTARIIPTRMGTSPEYRDNAHTIKDHPHAYGDKLRYCADSSSGRGSSPRVWGQVGLTTA